MILIFCKKIKLNFLLIFILLFLSYVALTYGQEIKDHLRVASYNVDNYGRMPRRMNGILQEDVGKPEAEKVAVSTILKQVNADFVGLMEVGEPSDLEDIQQRLKNVGINYPYTEYVYSHDKYRHLALLSKYPIIEKHSIPNFLIEVSGIRMNNLRGILDITVEPFPSYKLRIICLHLKSKLQRSQYNADELRFAEATAIRSYIQHIIAENPTIHLVVMGDFNDYKNSNVLRKICGNRKFSDYLEPLPLKDERGEYWTEYCKYTDDYVRLDYILVTQNMKSDIISEQSAICRPDFFNQASDHTPVYITIQHH